MARGASKPTKRDRLEARIPTELKTIFSRAAALRGQTLTDFVLSTVHEAAVRVVREHELLSLTRRDQLALARALLRPGKPNQRLKAAARQYRQSTKR